MKPIAILFILSMLSIGCSEQKAENNAGAVENNMEMAVNESHTYTPDMVVNTKDYACGMPTSAGISDTCHVDGKAYGFCSSECKAEFQKDPAKYLASKQ